MDSPGKYLRAERELRNLSLQEVSYFTKVREHFLKAIEEDRFELLPSAVYVKGFLTLYARYLGIDPNDVISRYQKYIMPPEIPVFVEPRQEIEVPRKRAVSRPFTISLSVLAFSLIILFLTRPTNHVSRDLTEKPSFLSAQMNLTPALALQGEENKVMPTPEPSEITGPKEAMADNSTGPESPPFLVLEAGIGAGVEKEGGRLALTEKCSEFTCDNQKVYFFTRIMAQKEGKIAHVWLWKGKEFYRKEIEVKPPAWSVYSYIVLRPPHGGNWNAEVRDVDKVLATLSFKASEQAPDSKVTIQ